MRNYYVYLLASKRNGTIYIGVTNNLILRVQEHKSGSIKGFTAKYKMKHLVYYEHTSEVGMAITREKQLKAWKWEWKIQLIESINPNWEDLYYGLL